MINETSTVFLLVFIFDLFYYPSKLYILVVEHSISNTKNVSIINIE